MARQRDRVRLHVTVERHTADLIRDAAQGAGVSTAVFLSRILESVARMSKAVAEAEADGFLLTAEPTGALHSPVGNCTVCGEATGIVCIGCDGFLCVDCIHKRCHQCPHVDGQQRPS